MDAGRFTLHRSGWDNSAQEGYDLGCDPEPGSSGVHGGRGRYRREEGFTRYQPRYEREGYPGLSVPGKRRQLEDIRDAQRHEKLDSFRDYGYKKHDSWEHDDRDSNDYRHRSRGDGDYESSRHHDYDSDRERSKRDRRKRDKERGGRVRDRSPDRDRWQDRSDSYGYDDVLPSRSPYGGSQEEGQYEPSVDNRHVHEEEHSPLIPSATVVVKGLSQKTVEDDLYRALEGWGPLKHVRVIKEKTSGVSRGFAFIDFPSVDAAEKLMDAIGNGLVVNGRRLFFEYSSRPTGGAYPDQRYTGRGFSTKFPPTIPTDWICTVCGYLNFARRILCLQCNEARGEDAPAADGSVSGHRGLEPAPSHVLVVRGLDDNVDEEILHYEFSKYAPIKDLRLIRDKFTHVSRGFAFIHFNSVEDATKALEAGNGTAIDKNGQVLRVAFAKSIHGPGNGIPQATGLAAAAIEAATFAQQYDSSGWAPKEFDPKPQSNADGHDSGFVWDETSGYYYDAASGFYYDGHRGLYYDGNNGIWYTYNQELQQYEPYVESSADPVTEDIPKPVDTEPKSRSDSKADHSNAVISALPVHNDAIHPNAVISARPVAAEKKPTLPEVVAAAAAAAQASTKKEKEKAKEMRAPGKAPSKKKISNALNLWKQRQSEDTTPSVDDRKVRGPNKISDGVGNSYTGMPFEGARQVNTAATCASGIGRGTPGRAADSGRGSEPVSTSFKTETSALGPKVGSKRRFTEAPQQVYRDRAAERRSLYGLTVPGDPMSDVQEMGPGSGRDMPFPPGVGGRSTSSQLAGPDVESYEVITPDKALDESNLGNRMLRNMGWQEGSGLGREGTGIVEPVQPQGGSERAGLGSQLQQRKLDGRFEAQPGDSYRVVIQKKALARFHEML